MDRHLVNFLNSCTWALSEAELASQGHQFSEEGIRRFAALDQGERDVLAIVSYELGPVLACTNFDCQLYDGTIHNYKHFNLQQRKGKSCFRCE